jgi:hypothetical protein
LRDFGSKQSTWRECARAPVEHGPGKRTLTETLSGASVPVQRKVDAAAPVMSSDPQRTISDLFGGVQRKVAGAAPDAAAIHASAQRGIATAMSPLPYAETIQRSFGRHDVSRIQTHAGPEAAASTHAMGAEAYAAGNHVVLGGRTDLHTVAHEAAHVIQQRGGVQLKGGVGQVGDAHEQHADAVADLVVQGKSAERLLDAYVPSSGDRSAPSADAAHGVQRRISGPDGQLLSWGEVMQAVGHGIHNREAFDQLYQMWREPATTYTLGEIQRALGIGGPVQAGPQAPQRYGLQGPPPSRLTHAPLTQQPAQLPRQQMQPPQYPTLLPTQPLPALNLGRPTSNNTTTPSDLGNFGSSNISNAPTSGMPEKRDMTISTAISVPVPVISSGNATASGEWSYNNTYWESTNGWSFYPGSAIQKKPDRLLDNHMKRVDDPLLIADLAQREATRKRGSKSSVVSFGLLGIPRGPTRGRELDSIDGIAQNWSPGKSGTGYDNARAHWEKHPHVGGRQHTAAGWDEDARVAATASYVKHAYEFMETNKANSCRQGNFTADGGSAKNVTIYYSNDYDTIAVFDQDMGVLRSFYDLNPSLHGHPTNKVWLRANGAQI